MLLPEFMRGAEDISTRTQASFLGEFYPNLPKIWYDIFVINCQLSLRCLDLMLFCGVLAEVIYLGIKAIKTKQQMDQRRWRNGLE